MEDLTYIVILNWNGRENTLECLGSISRIAYSPYRVIVVDNGSTDDSVAAIGQAYPQVEVIANCENLGFARGINVGIKAALAQGARYVLILNNDVVVDEGLLSELIQAAAADPSLGVLSPKIYEYHTQRVWFAGAKKRRFPPGFTIMGYQKKDGQRFNIPQEIHYAFGCGMLVKAEVFDRIGLFDEAYLMYNEDLDFCERARWAGYKVMYVPAARMEHKVSASAGVDSPFKWYSLARYMVPFFLKHSHHPYLSLLAYGAWVVAREFVKGNVRSIFPYLRGMRDGWRAAVAIGYRKANNPLP